MALSASEARKRLYPLIEEVNAEQEPVEIVSNKGTAFLVPEELWNSMNETLHLLGSIENAKRLIASIEDVRAGRYEIHDIADLENQHRAAAS